MKCAIITDIHHGPDHKTKKGTAARTLLMDFKTFIEATSVDFVVELGDRISNVNHDYDRHHMRDIADFFGALNTPCHHLLGNHDTQALNIDDNAEIMGARFATYSFRQDGIDFIVWNADTSGYADRGFTLPDTDIRALEVELEKCSYPIVILTHVPLDNGSMIGNYYFESASPNKPAYPPKQAARARHVIEQSGKVILCLNGHTHWNKYHAIDGIHYVTLPSLTETFQTYPRPHAAWTELEIDNKIRLRIHGETPMAYELPMRAEKSHWIHPDKPHSAVTA